MQYRASVVFRLTNQLKLHPFNHSECVCLFKNVDHFINYCCRRIIKVFYTQFQLFPFFPFFILLFKNNSIVFRNIIYLREIYLSLLVCFSICHVTIHCYLRLVNDYSKVRNTDKIKCVFILQLFNFQDWEDMEEMKRKQCLKKGE